MELYEVSLMCQVFMLYQDSEPEKDGLRLPLHFALHQPHPVILHSSATVDHSMQGMLIGYTIAMQQHTTKSVRWCEAIATVCDRLENPCFVSEAPQERLVFTARSDTEYALLLRRADTLH